MILDQPKWIRQSAARTRRTRRTRRARRARRSRQRRARGPGHHFEWVLLRISWSLALSRGNLVFRIMCLVTLRLTAPAVEPLKQLDIVAKAEAARLLRDSPYEHYARSDVA